MFQRILVPLDGSAVAESALETACGLAQAFAAQIYLVRCLSSLPPADFAARAEEFHEAHLWDENDALEYISGIATRLSASGLSVHRDLLTGTPAETIAQSAREHQVDLIVMTSHGRSLFSRLMLGSVAETLARIAPCPVMILRSSPGQD